MTLPDLSMRVHRWVPRRAPVTGEKYLAEVDCTNEYEGYRKALEMIAEPTISDPMHREYPAVKRLQQIARDALDEKDGG